MSSDKPVLWHIPVSHYNEKVRWALALQRHRARAQGAAAGGCTGGRARPHQGRVSTFPVLRLDGRSIGDSTAIIAALEERHPDPPLYPDDPAERAPRPRARGLLRRGARARHPPVRVPRAHSRPRGVRQGRGNPGPVRAAPGGGRRWLGRWSACASAPATTPRPPRLATRFSPPSSGLTASSTANEYLVGDSFTVADLTAASLFYPLVTPPEAPAVAATSERLEELRERLRERPGYRVGWGDVRPAPQAGARQRLATSPRSPAHP